MISWYGDDVLIVANSFVVIGIVVIFGAICLVVAIKLTRYILDAFVKAFRWYISLSAVQTEKAEIMSPEPGTVIDRSLSFNEIKFIVLDYPSYEELQAHLLSALPPCVRPANMPEKEWNNL